jgi:hypothetical protein
MQGGHLTRSILAIAGSAAIAGVAVSGRQELAPEAADACIGTLLGWDHPQKIPDYLAWESFFESVTQTDSSARRWVGPDSANAAVIRAHANDALARVRTSRRSQSPFDPSATGLLSPVTIRNAAMAERVAAAAVLSARDEILRALPEVDFERLHVTADLHARSRSFRLIAPGKTVDVRGATLCDVTVVGREFPHLVPEHEYWSFYLRTYASAAKRQQLEPGVYPAEHIQAIRRTRLPIPQEHILHFLEVAIETTDRIAQLRTTGGTPVEIAEAAMNGRATLVRILPGPVWILLNRDASRTRDSAVITFPPSY